LMRNLPTCGEQADQDEQSSKTRQAPPPEPTPLPEPIQPEPYDREVADLLADLHKAMAACEYPRADELTTRILLAAAGRSEEGSLRTANARQIPNALLSELDTAWAAASGSWGFAAQRSKLAHRSRVKFHEASDAFGWRSPHTRYKSFSLDATAEVPFYPSLRIPDRESDRNDAWRGEWQTTAVSIQYRLRSWE
jgi:eukaryotic-like serine/threonine-protein kinase